MTLNKYQRFCYDHFGRKAEEKVNEIIKKYQYGHFNGMEDIYEYSNSRDDIPQAKFVFVNRTMSELTKQNLINKHNNDFCEEGQIKDLNAWNEDAQCWNTDIIYRDFRNTDLICGVE